MDEPTLMAIFAAGALFDVQIPARSKKEKRTCGTGLLQLARWSGRRF
jgi:hypothetical protein